MPQSEIIDAATATTSQRSGNPVQHREPTEPSPGPLTEETGVEANVASQYNRRWQHRYEWKKWMSRPKSNHPFIKVHEPDVGLVGRTSLELKAFPVEDTGDGNNSSSADYIGDIPNA